MEARLAIAGAWRTAWGLTPVEAITAVAVTRAEAFPVSVATTRQVLVVAAMEGELPSVTGVPVPTTPSASRPIPCGAPSAVGVAPSQAPYEAAIQRLPLAALRRASAVLTPSPATAARVLPRTSATTATALQARTLRRP